MALTIWGMTKLSKEFDMEQFTRTCGYCQTEFITEWPTSEYCSRYHKEQARKKRKAIREGKTRPSYTRTCIGCATEFTTGRANQTYCSPDCRQWMTGQLKRERDRDYANKAKTPGFKKKLYWRDSGICGICNQWIDTSLKYPDPMSFSIDHIIPRSVKPDHPMGNLRPAHLGCNSLRSDKPA